MDDPTQMADAFNKFFSSIGSNIANSIPPTKVDPLSYITPTNYSNLFDLGNTGLIQVCNIITLCKNSLDLDGIRTNLIKRIAIEISVPLAHIFNLSLKTGVFSSRLKTSRTVLFLT